MKRSGGVGTSIIALRRGLLRAEASMGRSRSAALLSAGVCFREVDETGLFFFFRSFFFSFLFRMRPRLVHSEIQKVFKILRHIGICMKH